VILRQRKPFRHHLLEFFADGRIGLGDGLEARIVIGNVEEGRPPRQADVQADIAVQHRLEDVIVELHDRPRDNDSNTICLKKSPQASRTEFTFLRSLGRFRNRH
jgi:hypothetical protein